VFEITKQNFPLLIHEIFMNYWTKKATKSYSQLEN